MSDEEKALKEKNLAQEAYKRKEYDATIAHYSNAMKLNPKEMTFIYNIAKIHLEKKNYAESIKFCTRAIKVGKEQKANVKMVAKTMAMRGRAHKELGEVDKFKEDIDKAVKFLTTIANVKFGKERWGECIDFCQRAYEMGKENDFVDAEVLVLQSRATANLNAEDQKKLGNEAYKKRDFDIALKHYLKAAELNPNEITFLNNIAAVKLEQEKYKECLELCNKAIEVGKENGADSKKMEKAFDRQARAQKLLDEQCEWVKRGIQKANPATDLRDITVEYNSDTKEFVASLHGTPFWRWDPQKEHLQPSGNVASKTDQLPEVHDADNLTKEMALHFVANKLDPSNVNHVYDASELLFEKGNYKGCATLCRNAQECGTIKGGTNDRQVIVQLGHKFNFS